MYCALLLPGFQLQAALRHRPALWREAVAMLEGDALTEATFAAQAAGVRPGQTPAQAMARCMTLQLLRRSPEQEEALTHLLLEQAGLLSARIEATAPACCTLDLHAVPRLAFTPDALLEWASRTLGTLRPLALQARSGIAPNPDLALLAAQATTEEKPLRIVTDSAVFLDPLPLEALAPSPEIASIIHQWGVDTLGQFRRLPRSSVAARLGAEGAHLHDRAMGRTRRLLQLIRAAENYEETFEFEHEVDTAEPLLFLLRRFVDQLTRRVGEAGLVAGAMELTLTPSKGAEVLRTFEIPSPTAQGDVLFRMLEVYFESLRLEHPLAGIRLRLNPTRPEASQFRLFESSLRDPNRFAETLARITALVGSDRAGIPEPLENHEPDRFILRMPDFSRLPDSVDSAPAIGLPLRRFRPPRPARVELRGASRVPAYLEAGALHGRIVMLHGPYPLSGQWWEEGWNREEWDAELHTGTLCRLTRQRGSEPEWIVEGVYT